MMPEETGCFVLMYCSISSITFFFGLTMKRRLGRLKLWVNLQLVASKGGKYTTIDRWPLQQV